MLKIVPLGGLGEIGLNMMTVEYNEWMLVIDAGLMFPEEHMFGVDIVIPDFSYINSKRDMKRALILTHGHEDHIGAVPFVIKENPLPIYGTGFTLELLNEKFKDHRIVNIPPMHRIEPGGRLEFGPFRVEFIPVDHSIIESIALAISTPEGVLVHSGDFKIDHNASVGGKTDIARLCYYGSRGVLALLSDSTNVEKEGYSTGEEEIKDTLDGIFRSAEGRIIIAVFSSNVVRIRSALELAKKYGKRVCLSGKSIKQVVDIAIRQGFLKIEKGMELYEDYHYAIPDNEVVIITTGTQGEPMSSLARMALNQHKSIKIKRGDTIVLSSRFIPGNEKAITSLINRLYRMGAEVLYEKVSNIHSSGHAFREELKLMIRVTNPKFFIPIHGEFRHLVKHVQLAQELGIPPDRCLLLENGQPIYFNSGKVYMGEQVPTGRIFVDGKGVGDVSEMILRDRKRLSEEGLVIVLMAIDEYTGDILHGPDIISRGFILDEGKGGLLEEAKCVIYEVMDEIQKPLKIDWKELEPEIKGRLKGFFYQAVKRKPLIIPIIVPI